MFVPDVAPAAFNTSAQQQTVQKNDQTTVQQASVSGYSTSAVNVAPTAVRAAAQLDTSQDRATDRNLQDEERVADAVVSNSTRGVPSEEQQDQTETLQQRLEELANEALGDNTNLSVSFDEATDRFIYQTRNSESGEVVRQYPSEEFLNQISKLREVRGLVFEEKV